MYERVTSHSHIRDTRGGRWAEELERRASSCRTAVDPDGSSTTCILLLYALCYRHSGGDTKPSQNYSEKCNLLPQRSPETGLLPGGFVTVYLETAYINACH